MNTKAMASSDSKGRLSSIDALRGLAALVVVLYHARGSWWIGASETYRHYGLSLNVNAWLGYISVPLSLGNLGVTLFFVLSGYCIHRRGANLLAANTSEQPDWRGFFARRFFRIYPTYLAALLLTALIDACLASRTGNSPQGQDNSLFAFLVSCLSLQGYLAPHFGSNGVFWTLAMEMHLYFAYPLLFLLSRRWGPMNTLLFTLLVGFSYIAADRVFDLEARLPHRFQCGPVFFPYWFTWTLGFFLAEVEAGRVEDFGVSQWRLVGFGGFAVGLVLTLIGFKYPAEMCWALFFAALLSWSLKRNGNQFWSGKPGLVLAGIGVFSYSLYAIHAPLLLAFHAFFGPAGHRFVTIWPAIGGAACVIPVSWLFFRLVECWSIKKAARQR